MCQERCLVSRHIPRILIAAIFVIGGFGFLADFSKTQQMVTQGLTPFGLAGIAALATVIAIILKLGGGLMLMFNKKASTGAWMLIVFTVLATIMYHLNWNGDGGQMQMIQFLKNLAIIGGLMMFAKCPCPQCKANSECCAKEEGKSCCKQ